MLYIWRVANFGIQRLPACVVFRGTGNRRDHQRFIFASQRETFETADPLNSVEELSKFVRDVVNGNVCGALVRCIKSFAGNTYRWIIVH